MPISSCEIEVRDVSGTAVLVVSGDIDRDAESKVSTAYEQAVATDPRRVILDFATTEYINFERYRPHRQRAGEGPGRRQERGRRRAFGSLPGDLRDHPPVRLHRALPRRRGGSRTRRPGTSVARHNPRETRPDERGIPWTLQWSRWTCDTPERR